MACRFQKCAAIAVTSTLISGCYPSPPYRNPLSPDQVRDLLVKDVMFLAPQSDAATTAEVDQYRRFAIRSAVCKLGKHFSKARGTATLVFWLRDFEVRHAGENISVRSALSARVEGPATKGEYRLGTTTDARRNVPNPPSPAAEGQFGGAAIVAQLLSMRGDGYTGAAADDLVRQPTPCQQQLNQDVYLARARRAPA